MGELFGLVFVGSGGVLVLAGLLTAYVATQPGRDSLGLGVAAAGLALGGALCYWAAAWLVTRPAGGPAAMPPVADPGVAPGRGERTR